MACQSSRHTGHSTRCRSTSRLTASSSRPSSRSIRSCAACCMGVFEISSNLADGMEVVCFQTPDRSLEDLRDLFIWHFIVMPEDECCPLFLGERVDSFLDQAALLMRLHDPVRLLFSFPAKVEHIIQAKELADPLTAENIQREIDCDAIQPRIQRRISPKVLEASVCFDKHILNDIVSPVVVVEEPACDPVHFLLITNHQFIERRLIPVLELFDKFGVARGAHATEVEP